MKRSSALFLLAVALLATAAFVNAAKIVNLPGYKPERPFNMYSGYVNLDHGKKYFYWYEYEDNGPAWEIPVPFHFQCLIEGPEPQDQSTQLFRSKC